MTTAKELPVGTTLMMTAGEYSSYRVVIVAKVLKPINKDVWNAMGEACIDKNGAHPIFDNSIAPAWLIREGYIEEIEVAELHMGDYGECPEWEDA